MVTVKEILSISDYKITLLFNNEEIRRIDFYRFLELDKLKKGSIFQKFTEKGFISKVELADYGTICWEREIDFCPDTLYKVGEKI